MPDKLDSLIVLHAIQGDATRNPSVLDGAKCLVVFYDQPQAEERGFSRIDFGTMESTPASDLYERKRGAVELTANHHGFGWGVKRNGRPQGRYSSKHVKIIDGEDAEAVRETHAAMIAAVQAHRDAKLKAWGNAKKLTEKTARRLATDWPEVKVKKV